MKISGSRESCRRVMVRNINREMEFGDRLRHRWRVEEDDGEMCAVG